MKLIKPKVELLVQEPGLEGIYKMIDKAAGICYGRTELHKDSKAFVNELINKGHMRPLEFGTVYLQAERFTHRKSAKFRNFENRYRENPYSIMNQKTIIDKHFFKDELFVTTNFRTIIENDWFDDLKLYWCNPQREHFKRPCFLFTCSRGVADEFRTHISLSSMMQSTRYCDSSNLEIIIPQWYKEKSNKKIPWHTAMNMTEHYYNSMLAQGATRQEARGVLPLDMATKLCLCGFYKIDNTGWDRFLKLRCDKSAHPEAQYLANKVKELL